jgi:uncharacterized protein GlcG (DUF336 family)
MRKPAAVLTIMAGAALAAGVALATQPVRADSAFLSFKIMKPGLALELARATLADCRKRGYQVAVVVVDRFGQIQVAIRDSLAGPHTVETARRKAWTAVSFRTDTLALSTTTRSGTANSGIRFIRGALMLGGGVPVQSAGSIVGGIGVSGGPGGKADDSCARAGIAAIQDKLDF